MHPLPDTFYLRTFGCQMNDHDAERLAGLLAGMGMRRVAEPEEGGILLYNTCSIREKADTRLLGHLGAARRLKREDPGRLVVVAGCLAQSRREAFFAEHPYVDVLVGPQSLHELPLLLDERVETGRQVGAFQEETTCWSADLPRVRREGPAAWVQIMTGCTNFCSYCIVPHVRGPEASRSPDAIFDEVAKLVADGVREVTLLGQNVNAYGREPGFIGRGDFAGLLSALDEIPGLERIRFMTSHPKDVSAALIEAIASLPAVCEHLHLPVQSGSDRTLAGMGRGYTRADYLDLVRRLREAVPGLSLTTDLIVGFPGETEDDFEATLSLVEEVGYDAAFTFVYSPRPGTPAARLPGRPPEDVVERRMARLIGLVQTTAVRKNAALVGAVVEVLVEGRSRHDPAAVMGRTRTFKTVNLRCEEQTGTPGEDDGSLPVAEREGDGTLPRPGDLVRVLVEEGTSTSLRGSLVA